MTDNHEKTGWAAISWKAVAISILMICGGLIAYNYLETNIGHHAPKPWWYILALKTAETFIHVGALAVIFELLLHRQLFDTFIGQMRNLFNEDSGLAKSLSTESKQKRVLNTLAAHLGKEQGKAIFENLIKRYFTGMNPSRWNMQAEISLRDLPDDIKFTQENGKKASTTVTLSRDNYYSLNVSVTYEKLFNNGLSRIAFILTEKSEILNYWFNQEDCLYRDVVYLGDDNEAKIINELKKFTGDELKQVTEQFLKVEVKINGEPINYDVSISEELESVLLHLDKDQFSKFRNGDRVNYEVSTTSVILKDKKQYPLVLKDPCYNPSIRFFYPFAKEITYASPSVFFTCDSGFAPQINCKPEDKYIEVKPPNVGEPSWVFPNSGVLFTWR